MKIAVKASRVLEKAFKTGLRTLFGFDKWHTASLHDRSYAKGIIKYINKRPVRNSILEIGCGLGDILRKARYKTRQGYDIDSKVLRAARFLSFFHFPGSRIRYGNFTFPDTKLEGCYDVIIAANWIHHVEPEALKNNLSKYLTCNVNPSGVIIIDTVADKSYKYNHDIIFLTGGVSCEIEEVGAYERGRKIWAIKRTN